MPGQSPSFVYESLWQIPQAWTLIRTDPAPGSGLSRSTSSKGPFGRGTWTTRIFDMVPPHLDSLRGMVRAEPQANRGERVSGWTSRVLKLLQSPVHQLNADRSLAHG